MEKANHKNILEPTAKALAENAEPTLAELEYLDPKQLERFYGISVNRQKRLRVEKKLPYSKFGSYIRYAKKKINQLFKDYEVVA